MANASRPVDRFQDWINLILAVFLFISPWIFGFTQQSAPALNAWIAGVIVAAMSVAALVRFAEWEEWVNVVVGVWLVLSPWILGFAGIAAATWTCVVVGAIIAGMAAWEAWTARHPGRAAA